MLYIDSHESLELELLLSQVVEVQRENLNPTLPDLFWVGYGGRRIGLENKQASEIMGSLDSVEEQLGREIPSCDYTGLTIRGVITPTPDGFCQVWTNGHTGKRLLFPGKEFRQSYKGYRAWISRLWEEGVPVVEVPDGEALAITIAAMYESSQKDAASHKTFARLIPEKYWLNEADQRKKDLALTLMGVAGAKWGEEMALAAADWITSWEGPPTMATMFTALQEHPEAIRDVPLRSGKRIIGPAAVARLRNALGL